MDSFIYIIITKVPAIVVGMYYFKRLSLPFSLIWLQVVLALAAEITGYYISISLHRYNTWLFNCYTLVGEVWLLALIGYLFLRQSSARRIVMPGVLIVTGIWQYGIYTRGLNLQYGPFILAAFTFNIIVYLLILFFHSLRGTPFLQNAAVWYALSVIIFFAGALPYYGAFNYMREQHPELLKSLFGPIIWTLNFIRYPMAAIVLYLASKRVGEDA